MELNLSSSFLYSMGGRITGFFAPKIQGKYFKLVSRFCWVLFVFLLLFYTFYPNYFQVDSDGGKDRVLFILIGL